MAERQIVACAVIGREHDVLVIRHPSGECVLPGSRVGHDEWIEDALGRGVREVLAVGVSSATFLCLIEDSDGLFVVFDVTPEAESDPSRDETHPELTWAGPDQLATLDLRPAALRDVLRVGEPPTWLPQESTRDRWTVG